MGRTASSSKSKLSKKKSKISSQTRRKKASKRNKSKRVYSEDSDSSYSDESVRSLSISSSDSEDVYVSRKGQSRVREKVKSSKKRIRRSSSSDDSSINAKVRKRSKRNGDSKVRKKMHKKKKKKSKRKVSVSSSSSDSGILRTRRHDSSSGTEESDYERKRGRSKKRKNDKTSSRIGSKKRKLRSRSCSSCSRHSDDSIDVIKDKVVSEIDQNRELVTSDIVSRRLKSVITVVQPCYEEETGQDKDENKEEILCDQDDYPSCRSNDSNDGGKRNLAHRSYIESEKVSNENMVGEEDFASELVAEESKLSSRDRIDQSDRASIKHPGNENEIDTSATTAGSGSEDLETILRQKALENLMRFRGPHRNPKPPSHHDNESGRSVKSFTAKADDVPGRSSKQELSSRFGETGGRNQHNKQAMRKNSSRLVQTEMNLDGRGIGIESITVKQRVVHPSAGVEISGKFESITSSLMEQSLGSNLEQVLPSPVSAHVQGMSPAALDVVPKKAAYNAETIAGSIGNNQNVGDIDACRVAPESSCIKPISEEHNIKQCQDEPKGNSFEQKTMSVMRGGEMVQVSYKVYIPNKAPALARRKLQR